MVTNITPKFKKGQYAGTSADQKPMDVQNGSVYHEIDTGAYYMFDAEGKQWYVQEDNGGGGGSGAMDHTKLANRDKPKQHPIKAIDGLQEALDEKANKADVYTKDEVYSKAEANQTFANALVRTVQGEVIAVDDMSPLEHEVKCTVSGVPDLSKVTVSRYGGNLVNIEDARDPTYLVTDIVTSINSIRFKKKVARSSAAVQVDVYLPVGEYYASGKIETTFGKGGWGMLDDGVLLVDQASAGTINKKFTIEKAGTYKFIMYTPYAYNTTDDTVFTDVTLTYGGIKKPWSAYVAPTLYTPSPSGTVSGMTSLSPNMTILTDTPGALLDVTYNADVNKVLEKKDVEIASLADRIKALEDKATNLPTV